MNFCSNSIVKCGHNFILVLLNHMIKKKVEKSHLLKWLNFRVGSKWHIVWFFGFLSITSFKTIELQKLGVFWKIQEIWNNMGTRICKIIEEMSEIIEPKAGNPKNSVSRNWAILSHPWNLTFFEDEIFHHFSYLYGLKVPKWNCAHILLWN